MLALLAFSIRGFYVVITASLPGKEHNSLIWTSLALLLGLSTLALWVAVRILRAGFANRFVKPSY